ncbi:YbaB/EbfC DNA-binding family protein [Prauserella shujinwangii]|uniref:YbaB/EbfC DNA-binding family protein n=1 Tax=Prauserella shujinwangii TaxID=1453103 RepID=A0A2T0LLL6_9PSEU|nr:YbaB/EbfC family nucleoid-associated protein [Prauserella shujinwangii]PRX43931.1 YbaB/EbfC DNA-binding family protein [Prauserella shujinwangii]
MSAEFDRLVAQFEQFQSKLKNVDEQFANLGQMQRQIADLEAVATSPDRSITVVAGPGGSVKDIKLTEAALAQQPQALSSALLSTLQQAVAEAARKQAGIVEEHVGDDMHLTDQVLETQAQLFGTSPEELRERTEEERPARRADADEVHDDYSQQSVLRSSDEQPPGTPPPSATGSQGDDFLRNLFSEDDR